MHTERVSCFVFFNAGLLTRSFSLSPWTLLCFMTLSSSICIEIAPPWGFTELCFSSSLVLQNHFSKAQANLCQLLVSNHMMAFFQLQYKFFALNATSFLDLITAYLLNSHTLTLLLELPTRLLSPESISQNRTYISHICLTSHIHCSYFNTSPPHPCTSRTLIFITEDPIQMSLYL